VQQQHEQSVARREGPLWTTIRQLQDENVEFRKQLGVPAKSMTYQDLQSMDPMVMPASADAAFYAKGLSQPPGALQEGWNQPGQALLVVPSRLASAAPEPEAEKEEDLWPAQQLANGQTDAPEKKQRSISEDTGASRSSNVVEQNFEDVEMFEVWPEWNEEGRKATQADRLGSDNARTDMVKRSAAPEVSKDDSSLQEPANFFPNGVLSPNNPILIFWNIAFMFVLAYELLMLPMSAFDMPTTGIYSVLPVFCMLFWTADFLVTSNTAFYTKRGHVKNLRKEIMVHYAKGWLTIDVLLVSIDWLEFTGITGNSMKGGKAVRAFRILRVMRILRMKKLKEVLQKFDEFINSQYFTIICSMVVNVAAILMISHFLGCIWFVIGNEGVEGRPSWVGQYSFEDADWEYQYLTSLHWSITQFTPGSMHVQPQNILERSFAIVVLVAGMIIFSSIVSSITAATNGLKSMNAKYTKQVYIFRKMCKENHIRKDLLGRIMRYSEHFVQPRMNRVEFKTVELMSMLPKTFVMEVTLEVYGKSLTPHPLFAALGQRTCLASVCSSCLSEVVLELNETLFSPGDQAHCMYFVSEGRLTHHVLIANPNYPVHLAGGKVETEILTESKWFGEAVLWTPWIWQGNMNSSTPSLLCAVSSKSFRDVLVTQRGMYAILKNYAREFILRMNERSGFLTDTDEDDLNLSDVLQVDECFTLLPPAQSA